MREKTVQVEHTGKEILLMAQSMYLSTVCLRNPQWFVNDQIALRALIDIAMAEDEWLAFGQKMMKVCLTANTTNGC